MACVAHALHDGHTDLTFVMLPVTSATAMTALAVCPLAFVLAPRLAPRQ
jgi:hypothetical protein